MCERRARAEGDGEGTNQGEPVGKEEEIERVTEGVRERESKEEGGSIMRQRRDRYMEKEGDLKRQCMSLQQHCLSARAVKPGDKAAHFVDTKHCK